MAWFCASKVAIWVFLLKMAAMAVQVHAQSSRAGFISIDCGIASNFSYVDKVTNISYVSDDGYIDAGSSYTINEDHKTSTLPSQLLNVRSFPVGDRNCYKLPAERSQRYLVRATFMYGNYDGKNANKDSPLQFDLHLGINLWRTIKITNASSILNQEALTVATTDFLSICLINTGKGDPFISTLELRPLKDTMYNISQSDLALFIRLNMGPLADDILRYPDDSYDRLWEPFNQNKWTRLSTNQSVAITEPDNFEAPSAVLQTAATPIDGMAMNFSINSHSKNKEFYHILYFTELENLTKDSSVRLFDVYRNGDLRMGDFSPTFLSSDWIYSTVPFNGSTSYEYLLNATANSTLPPLINAMEMYSVIPATEVPTDLDDVHTINGIREQYDIVKRNWMGDPCSPPKYIWDGLNCRYGSPSSRITKLNLSSSGLSGPISSSFANLTELIYLNLANNSLSGAIPDNLGNMQSLLVLILPCNYSTAPIPASLRQRSNEGQVILRYDDGAGACENSAASSLLSSSTIVAVLSIVISSILIGK